MFSLRQKREISEAVQKILRATNNPELPPNREIEFQLHVEGEHYFQWADIRNNAAEPNPGVNPHNELTDPRPVQQ